MFWGTVLAATVVNKVSTLGKVINRVAKIANFSHK